MRIQSDNDRKKNIKGDIDQEETITAFAQPSLILLQIINAFRNNHASGILPNIFPPGILPIIFQSGILQFICHDCEIMIIISRWVLNVSQIFLSYEGLEILSK